MKLIIDEQEQTERKISESGAKTTRRRHNEQCWIAQMPTGFRVGFSDLVGDFLFLTFFRASGPLIAPYPFTEREVLKASRAW